MRAAATLDQDYTHRVKEAQANGQVLRYLARARPEGGTVDLVPVDQDGLLGALRGPTNYFAFHTERYTEEPLVVSGPGAGPEVTAAGVLGDIVDLAVHQVPSPSAPG